MKSGSQCKTGCRIPLFDFAGVNAKYAIDRAKID